MFKKKFDAKKVLQKKFGSKGPYGCGFVNPIVVNNERYYKVGNNGMIHDGRSYGRM
tara:strand:- start:161 stop:328 length:168 start_codon:yes stop_codon:yes gene_type:complete